MSTITGCSCAASSSPVTGSPVSGQVASIVAPAATFCAWGPLPDGSSEPSSLPQPASTREVARRAQRSGGHGTTSHVRTPIVGQ